jgi:surface-anchored protein
MTPLPLRTTFAAATAALAAALTGGAPALATPAGPQADGADLIALSVESGALRMSFRGDGQRGADPQDLRFRTSDSPAGVIPDDPAFAFLGRPGAPVWSLQDGTPFSTFDATAVAGPVTLDLVSVEGPGTFAAYTLSAWGRPALLFDSDGQRSARLPAGHRLGGVVWMFDAAGAYRVTLRATTSTGTRTLKDEATYQIQVADQAEVVSAPRAAPTATGGNATPEQAPLRAGATTPASGRRVISDGHVDMGPQLSGGTLTIKLKDDATSPPTWLDLAGVLLKVTDKAVIDVPSAAGYEFLGKAGDKVYLLPQSQQAGIVWPGWNTQHESVVSGTRGNVTWRLTQVSGPGEFKLFRTGSFGTPEVVFDSAGKLPQQLAIAPNTHAHGNWAFTKAGTYRLGVEMSATTTGGKTVSDARTLTIAVGDGTDTGSGSGSGSGTGSGSGSGPSDAPSAGPSSSPSNGGNGGNGGGLARTGINVMGIAGGGGLLLAAGTTAVLATRRRRGEQRHDSTAELPNENENH